MKAGATSYCHSLLIGFGILIWTSVFYSCGTTKAVSKSEDKNDQSKSFQAVQYEEPNLSDSHFFNGMRKKLDSDYHDAVTELTKFTQMNPKEPAGFYQLAKLQLEQFSNTKESLKNSKIAFKLDNTNKWYRMLYADNLAFNGEFEKGAKLYSAMIDEQDYQREYFFKQLVFYEKAGAYDKMLDVITIMDTYTNEEDDVLDGLKLEVYKLQKDKKNIGKTLEKLAADNPDDYGKKLLLAEFYQNNKQQKRADSIYNTFNSDDLDESGRIAFVYSLIQRKDTLQLQKQITQAYLLDKDSAAIMVVQNALAMAADQYPYVVDFYVKTLANIAADNQAHHYAAEFLMGYYSLVRNIDSAGLYAVRSFELGSQDIGLFGTVIGYYLGKQEYNNLIDFSAREVKKIDSFSVGYYAQALAYMYLENDTATLKSLQNALTYMSADYVPSYRSDVFALKGDAYHRMKEHLLSDQAYDSALYYNPKNATALNNYAYYLSERNERLKHASEMSEKSLTIEENQPSYLDTYGWIQYKLGNYEDAKKYIRKAIDVSNAPSAELWEHLGDVEFKLGNKVKAIEYWRIAVSSGSDKKELNDKIEEHE